MQPEGTKEVKCWVCAPDDNDQGIKLGFASVFLMPAVSDTQLMTSTSVED